MRHTDPIEPSPAVGISRPPPRSVAPWATLLYWVTSLLCLAVGTGLAAWLSLIAVSLDPAEMIQAGTEPWMTAGRSILGAIGLGVATLLGLRLWHTRRFRPVALLILGIALIGVAMAVLDFYAEYT